MLPILLGLVMIASLLLGSNTVQSMPEHRLYAAGAKDSDTQLFARDKRMGAHTIVLAGRYITGVTKTKSRNKITDLYEKSGNQKRARNDFYILNPNNVQHLAFPYGGFGLAGRVGSRILLFRGRDLAEDSRPTLEIFRPGKMEPETKIVYGTKTKIYYPDFLTE